MKLTTALGPALLSVLFLAACDEKKEDVSSDKPLASAQADGPAKAEAQDDATKPARAEEKAEEKADPSKLDSAGREAVADAVVFKQGAEKDGLFSGKLENSSKYDIALLSFKAFAYDGEGKLLEMVEGKHNKKLEAGQSVDVEVGPFKAAAGNNDVSVEVVVGWMNIGGTSWQRPVPKDRKKGGPNNALAK